MTTTNHSKWGSLVSATSPLFLGIPFHSHTHAWNTGNSIVPRIKCILQRDEWRGKVGGAVKLQSVQCGYNHTNKTNTTKYFQTPVHIVWFRTYKQKHRKSFSSVRIHHKADEDKAGEEQKGATAVVLRKRGNNNTKLESKCFVTVTMQTNNNLCTPSYRAERYKLRRNSA
jgi:hypothetical protein